MAATQLFTSIAPQRTAFGAATITRLRGQSRQVARRLRGLLARDSKIFRVKTPLRASIKMRGEMHVIDTLDLAENDTANVILVEPRTESQRPCAERVSALLLSGAELRQDHRRPAIYDLRDGNDVYWLYMATPGQALLLGCRHLDGSH
jgi:hypothetical protein